MSKDRKKSKYSLLLLSLIASIGIAIEPMLDISGVIDFIFPNLPDWFVIPKFGIGLIMLYILARILIRMESKKRR